MMLLLDFVLLKILVDQISDFVTWFTMTRLPSAVNVSFDMLREGSGIGISLLATHTSMNLGILLNHMPRYQLGKVVFPDDLLEPVWKKPSANLPLLETSRSLLLSALPAARVLPVAAAQGCELISPRHKSSQNSMRQGRNMATCGMGSERRVADEESTMEGCILWCICLAQQPELETTDRGYESMGSVWPCE